MSEKSGLENMPEDLKAIVQRFKDAMASPPPPSPHGQNCFAYDGVGCQCPATPSSPEPRHSDHILATELTRKATESASPPAEITEALDALMQFASEDQYQHFDSYDEWKAAHTAARSALVSLYTRQREEIERQEEDNVDLSSQLERLKADSGALIDKVMLATVKACAEAEGHDGIPWDWSIPYKTIRDAALRLSSDSGTGGEK